MQQLHPVAIPLVRSGDDALSNLATLAIPPGQAPRIPDPTAVDAINRDPEDLCVTRVRRHVSIRT